MEYSDDYDAIIIGAGFAGMYALRRFREDLGWNVRVLERGDDVGGTWYWNRYPGARCDVESMYYSYSFDEDLEQEWDWTERFATQPEILDYANHVADRFDLRRDISFGTEVRSATFDETTNHWTVEDTEGNQLRAPHLITAVGCLSATQVPDLPGLDTFAGRTLHTGRWPHDGVDLAGLRVAVIGTGSSGIQVIPQIAQQADHLTVFQRTPAYSLPAGNRPLERDEVARIKSDYRSIRHANSVSRAGVPITPPIGSALEVPIDAGRAEMMKRWDEGGTSLLTTFIDTSVDLNANAVLADFVRERIHEIVEDPETAELLSPRDYPVGAKRICLGTDYFATYNRDNVRLVSVRETPIERLTERGLVVDGVEHEFDVIVFATGYDAMTGPLNAIDIHGVDGRLLRDEWRAGPRTFLGISSAGFPNLFMLTGPGSPSVLVNVIVSIEQHVDFLCDFLTHARGHDIVRIEAQHDAQDRWVERVNEAAAGSLHMMTTNWYTGTNIPGKPRVFMPFVGGMAPYREACDDSANHGYRGFSLTRAESIAAPSATATI